MKTSSLPTAKCTRQRLKASSGSPLGLRSFLYCLMALLDELAGERVLQLGGDDGQAVQEERHVDACFRSFWLYLSWRTTLKRLPW